MHRSISSSYALLGGYTRSGGDKLLRRQNDIVECIMRPDVIVRKGTCLPDEKPNMPPTDFDRARQFPLVHLATFELSFLSNIIRSTHIKQIMFATRFKNVQRRIFASFTIKFLFEINMQFAIKYILLKKLEVFFT